MNPAIWNFQQIPRTPLHILWFLRFPLKLRGGTLQPGVRALAQGDKVIETMRGAPRFQGIHVLKHGRVFLNPCFNSFCQKPKGHQPSFRVFFFCFFNKEGFLKRTHIHIMSPRAYINPLGSPLGSPALPLPGAAAWPARACQATRRAAEPSEPNLSWAQQKGSSWGLPLFCI